MDDSGMYYVVTANDQNMYTFYHCPEECSTCTFPNNCTACVNGYYLSEGKCLKQTPCVDNKYEI